MVIELKLEDVMMEKKIKLYWFEVFQKIYDEHAKKNITPDQALNTFLIFGNEEEIAINKRIMEDNKNDRRKHTKKSK